MAVAILPAPATCRERGGRGRRWRSLTYLACALMCLWHVLVLAGRTERQERGGAVGIGYIVDSVVAGSRATTRFSDGSVSSHLDGHGTNAAFEYPTAITMDSSSRRLLIADAGNDAIRSLSLSSPQRYRTKTFAGIWGQSGDGVAEEGSRRDTGLSSPYGISRGPSGDVFVADTGAGCIRRISPNGHLSTLAGCWYRKLLTDMDFPLRRGDGCLTAGRYDVGEEEDGAITDGFGEDAAFRQPTAIDTDQHGNVFVLSEGGTRVRRITPGGNVTSIAKRSEANVIRRGLLPSRTQSWPSIHQPSPRIASGGIAVHPSGKIVYFTGSDRHAVLAINLLENKTSIVAGSSQPGFSDGRGTSARFCRVNGLCLRSTSSSLLACDSGNGLLRAIDVSTGEVTTVAGEIAKDEGLSNSQEESPRGAATLSPSSPSSQHPFYPVGVAEDASSGELFVTESALRCVRRLVPRNSSSDNRNNGMGRSDGGREATVSGEPKSVPSDADNNAAAGGGGESGGVDSSDAEAKRSGQWSEPLVAQDTTRWVRAIFNFKNRTRYELSFKLGDRILLTRPPMSKDYLVGTVIPKDVVDPAQFKPTNSSRIGLVPVAYVNASEPSTNLREVIAAAGIERKRGAPSPALIGLQRFFLQRCYDVCGIWVTGGDFKRARRGRGCDERQRRENRYLRLLGQETLQRKYLRSKAFRDACGRSKENYQNFAMRFGIQRGAAPTFEEQIRNKSVLFAACLRDLARFKIDLLPESYRKRVQIVIPAFLDDSKLHVGGILKDHGMEEIAAITLNATRADLTPALAEALFFPDNNESPFDTVLLTLNSLGRHGVELNHSVSARFLSESSGNKLPAASSDCLANAAPGQNRAEYPDGVPVKIRFLNVS